jgi:hypothetical protein
MSAMRGRQERSKGTFVDVYDLMAECRIDGCHDSPIAEVLPTPPIYTMLMQGRVMAIYVRRWDAGAWRGGPSSLRLRDDTSARRCGLRPCGRNDETIVGSLRAIPSLERPAADVDLRNMRPLVRSALYARPPPVPRAPQAARLQSSSAFDKYAATATLSPRWLSVLKTRIGITKEQVTEAGSILHDVNFNWKNLVAGSEGFLTGKGRWGLHRHQVAWGEMVSSPFDSSMQTRWLMRLGWYTG